MKQLTAVEWLFRQLWDEPKDKFTWNTILMNAKAMEKEQIIDTYRKGFMSDDIKLADDYYNEQFKQDNL